MILYLRHKDRSQGDMFVHRHPQGYALRKGRNDGIIAFEGRFPAKNFRAMFFNREDLEIVDESELEKINGQ